MVFFFLFFCRPLLYPLPLLFAYPFCLFVPLPMVGASQQREEDGRRRRGRGPGCRAGEVFESGRITCRQQQQNQGIPATSGRRAKRTKLCIEQDGREKRNISPCCAVHVRWLVVFVTKRYEQLKAINTDVRNHGITIESHK